MNALLGKAFRLFRATDSIARTDEPISAVNQEVAAINSRLGGLRALTHHSIDLREENVFINLCFASPVNA